MSPIDDRYFDHAVEPMSTLTVSRNQIFKPRAVARHSMQLRGGQSGDSFAAGPWKFTFLAGSSSAGRASPREEYLSQ
jgi:hypothetical protein